MESRRNFLERIDLIGTLPTHVERQAVKDVLVEYRIVSRHRVDRGFKQRFKWNLQRKKEAVYSQNRLMLIRLKETLNC